MKLMSMNVPLGSQFPNFQIEIEKQPVRILVSLLSSLWSFTIKLAKYNFHTRCQRNLLEIIRIKLIGAIYLRCKPCQKISLENSKTK